MSYVLLTDGDSLSGSTADHRQRYGDLYETAFLYGGEDALSPQVEATVRDAIS